MNFNPALFFEVFSIGGLMYAIGAGLAFGATVPLYLSLRFPPKTPISTRTLMLVVGGTTLAAFSLFFAGQVVQAASSGDPLWPRALARMALSEVFSVSIGLGLGIARSFAHKR